MTVIAPLLAFFSLCVFWNQDSEYIFSEKKRQIPEKNT
jgi:hypothetical protein